MVLDQFCTLMASYTQKVASFLNEVDLPVKQLADYTNFEGLCWGVSQRAGLQTRRGKEQLRPQPPNEVLSK